MLHSLVYNVLRQRLVIAVLAVVGIAFGVDAARKLSVDAFPDVTNVQVQIATEAPGRSPEEVERFVTVPLEIATTGLPSLTEMRSLNKPGLSLITLVFTDATNVYFARQLVMERMMEVAATHAHSSGAIADFIEDYRKMIACDGVAVWSDGHITLTGETFEETVLGDGIVLVCPRVD